ncbi:acyl-CoA desaturase [Lunatimonas sp.]|uniref:fatty acid desaturase family protein n=1 Tax=Lunatimonas sp. TaxID=2060141 RepID=UPI00344C14FB
MVSKTLLFLSLTVIFYVSLLFGGFPLYVNFLLAAGLGSSMAFIGFNVCHDALHGAYSSKPWKNHLLGWLFNIIGANAYIWKITHNQIHHTYTNIVGHDADLEVAPGMIRIHAEEELKPVHKYQHIYAFFLYSLSSLSWFYRKDYIKFFGRTIGRGGHSHPKSEVYKLFLYKGLYYVLFLVLPFLVMDHAWWQILLVLLVMNLVEGTVMGNVFQLAHLVELTSMPNPHEEATMEDSWAVHQMKTTANFARESKLVCYLVGGLNFQIEHHLFPNVCHVHYPEISKIVQATAKEFGLPYHESPTFFSAFGSHVRFLKQMGRPVSSGEIK